MTWLIFLALGGVTIWQIALHTGAGARKLECAYCDLYILGARPSQGEAVLCSHCRQFSLFDQRKLVKPAPDHVANKPAFCAELPIEGVRWPASCCACNQPAIRTVPLRLQYQQDASFDRELVTRAATLGMFKAVDRTTITLDVPHCGVHGDGAALVMPYEREQPNFGIAFRSYPYFAEFKALNRSTPRKATMFGGQVER